MPGLNSRKLMLKGLNDSMVAAYYKQMSESAILLGAQPNSSHSEMMDVLKLQIRIANVKTFKYHN